MLIDKFWIINIYLIILKTIEDTYVKYLHIIQHLKYGRVDWLAQVVKLVKQDYGFEQKVHCKMPTGNM